MTNQFSASLTVLILTRNESAQIEACLESAAGADEIVVIDDGSTDNTTSLAKKKGATVVNRKLNNFAEQRNFALTKASSDWIFFLDADERFSPSLLKSIRFHQRTYPRTAGSVVRRSFAFGRRHRFGALKPDRIIRLFPKGSVHWEGTVHERPIFTIPIHPLKGHLDHFTYHDWPQHLAKMEHYSTLWAEAAWARGWSSSYFRAALRAGAGFIKMFFLNLGLLGGPDSWTLCWHHGVYTYAKYKKLTDLTRTKTKP